MVFQTGWFFTHTNESHNNLLWNDNQIHKWEHQKYWNNLNLTENQEFLNIDKILQMLKLPNVRYNNGNLKDSII